MNVIVSITRPFAVALVLVLTATGLCAGGAEEAPAAAVEKEMVLDPTTGEMVEAPRYGGTITALSRDWGPATFDQYLSAPQLGAYTHGTLEKLGLGDWGVDRNVWKWDLASAVYPEELVIGALAESWDISSDNLTYTFHIRQGVHFHDKAPVNGREMTAKDVEYSFHRMLGNRLTETEFSEAEPSVHIGHWKALPVDSITATDTWTVVIKLTQPDPRALTLMTDATTIYIVPREVIDTHGDMKDWRNFIGTGPWMMDEYVESSSVTYTRNPNYWGFDEKFPQNRLPYADGFRWLIMQDQATMTAAFRTGRVDFQGGRSSAVLKSLDDENNLRRTNPEIVITQHVNRSDYGMGMNMQKAPFDDIRVRKAMQMALDRETLHETYFKGWGSPTPNSLLANDLPGVGTPFEEWPEEIKKLYEYNPTEAERLLDEAGYPRGADGIRFELTMAHYELTDLDYAELVSKTYFRDIGVEVEVIPVAGADWAATVSAAEWDFFGGMTMAGRYQEPSGFLGQHTTGASANRCQCADPVYDALFEQASNASTRQEILPLYRKLNERLRDQVYFVWGQETPLYSVQQPWIKGRNGEYVLATNVESVIMARLWVDQELKASMGY